MYTYQQQLLTRFYMLAQYNYKVNTEEHTTTVHAGLYKLQEVYEHPFL